MRKPTKPQLRKIIAVFLTGLLVVLGGIGFFLPILRKTNPKPDSPSQNNHNLPPKPRKPPLPPKKNKTKREIVKIKKTNDPHIFSWESRSENENGSSFSKFDTKIENIPKLFQETGLPTEIWVNWEQELKDNCWLVKEKSENLGKITYKTYFEND
ncbi:MAG: hypothetical protein I3273_06595 [Candidatus Moeniiplasma glomeromycotorum]|nr:hypothetical protein [Candidatus Moeniiplasma glomeromycotorum]MCE8168220.1 hypothetical protein [Candidatus Moeniiplasma glomeromycotorum]MCE8169753.1 hypothetical protein [Candidatus Moeniiplasma glomeromycotorum]